MKQTSLVIYEKLKHRIISGFYSPGAHLKEAPIAREMGSSRTPVRSAFDLLIEAGLAEQKRNRGVFVASWSNHDLKDMFRLRIQLEPYAARLAAERSSSEVISALKKSNAMMADAIERLQRNEDTIDTIQQANSEFHRQLLLGSGSPRLIEMLGTLIDMPIIMRSFLLYEFEDLSRSLQHHKDILFAIEVQDGDLAQAVMEVHLRISSQRFLTQRLDGKSAANTPHIDC